jgi:hypothetical protein
MKTLLIVAALAAAFPAAAEPITDPQRARATAMQAEQQRRVEQAREQCLANRGTDCDTLAGLREWLLNDRSRADAVLDRIGGESASTGTSAAPVRPEVPAVSPRHTQ